MSKIDHLGLTGSDLRLFVTVLEAGSVTAAGARLGMTQSAVSHGLGKLRRVVGDPLFVKCGRGIAPTEHAKALAAAAQDLLDGLEHLVRPKRFDPASARFALTIAANDFQRDLLLPGLFRRLRRASAAVAFRIIHSSVPHAAMLRESQCDLVLSPHPPVGTDIVQKRLFEDRYACFFDPLVRPAPRTRAEYLAARHITVAYGEHEKLDFDRRLEALGIARDIAVATPSFSGVPAFLRGSDMLASMPSLLHRSFMSPFAHVPLPPLGTAGRRHEILPMYLAWHRRHQLDPAHAWLREQLFAVAAQSEHELQRAEPDA